MEALIETILFELLLRGLDLIVPYLVLYKGVSNDMIGCFLSFLVWLSDILEVLEMGLVNQNASCALIFVVRNVDGYPQSFLALVKQND